MSDSKNNPPPDDFSATTPNIKIPKGDLPTYNAEPASDWEKTNYNYSPKDLGTEDWNKPKAPQMPPQDFGKTFIPNQPGGKEANWGATEVHINLPNNQPEQFERPQNIRNETPRYESAAVVNVPQNEQPKFQMPIKEAAAEESKASKKGGMGWLWASLGLLGMFLFSVIVLLGVYAIFLNKTGFEFRIDAVPAGSDVMVNGSHWGVTDSSGAVYLKSLRAGETKLIEIKNPTVTCRPIEVKPDRAVNGAKLEDTASCTAGPAKQTTGTAPSECLEIKKGDFAKAAKCAYDELDKLEKAEKAGQMYTVDQLLYAMNLYIVNFDSNKFAIKPNDMAFVARASGFMKKLPPTTVVEIGGHTDNAGTDAKNQPLSENRATAVKDALLQFGITPSMLQTKGYGSKKPKESNDTPDGMFRNRRIEYTVLSK